MTIMYFRPMPRGRPCKQPIYIPKKSEAQRTKEMILASAQEWLKQNGIEGKVYINDLLEIEYRQ